MSNATCPDCCAVAYLKTTCMHSVLPAGGWPAWFCWPPWRGCRPFVSRPGYRAGTRRKNPDGTGTAISAYRSDCPHPPKIQTGTRALRRGFIGEWARSRVDDWPPTRGSPRLIGRIGSERPSPSLPVSLPTEQPCWSANPPPEDMRFGTRTFG